MPALGDSLRKPWDLGCSWLRRFCCWSFCFALLWKRYLHLITVRKGKVIFRFTTMSSANAQSFQILSQSAAMSSSYTVFPLHFIKFNQLTQINSFLFCTADAFSEWMGSAVYQCGRGEAAVTRRHKPSLCVCNIHNTLTLLIQKNSCLLSFTASLFYQDTKYKITFKCQ